MNEVFGNYRLADLIGSGGLGEVFRAQDAEGGFVALKRLAEEHRRAPEYAALFARECTISTQLDHELLLSALDSGEVEGWPFMTTRLADGGSLQSLLSARGDHLVGEDLASTVRDIGEAVAALHSQGYAHSDLSPGNILFIGQRAHLTDFGSATALGEKQERPQGTYAYMSPEQVRGEPLDERSDIFSLASLLWQCVTGERLFWRDAQHLTFMAVVDAKLPSIPDALLPAEALLHAALHKEQSERPGDAAEFCRQFAAALAP